MEENILLICPNEEKMNILDQYQKDDKLHNIKFMNKKEFMNNYFYSYDETAIQYLMDKYNLNLEVAKVYLSNLYVIDLEKQYQSQKLIFLQNIKQELLSKNLLQKNKSFKEYLKNKKVIVKKYYDLDKYEEKALNHQVDIPDVTLKNQVVECDTLEEEVNDVCLNIINLLNKGVDINKIFLSNISEDYFYTIEKLFKYYNIPINIKKNNSIYSTKVVNDYLKNNVLDLENQNNLPITRKLVNVLNSLTKLDFNKPSYEKILIDKLKNTNISYNNFKNAVNIKDLYKNSFKDDEYVFVLGFNQDVLPKMEKDIEYINDANKKEVELYTTNEKNKRNKKVLIYLLSQIKNLHLSYKKTSPFSSFYPSSLIEDLNLEIIKPLKDNYCYSNKYNKLRLGEKLDLYYKYNEMNEELETLNNHYDIPYKKYSNQFTGIKNNIYLSNLKQPLNISYSSMNDYSECAFKYYLNHVLNLSVYEEQFHNFIGNMYHRILSLYKKINFDFEQEYQKYLKERELSFKEKILLHKIKKELLELIDSLKKQQLITGYDEEYLEKKIEIPIENKKVSVIFKGFIDKIMYYQKVEDVYYSIIDYKTGTIDTNIEPLKYGLHMQLPVYLYLINKSHIFKNPIFTGIYYQNILFNYPTCTDEESYLKEKKDRLKLQGYSIENPEILERFDTTYEKSVYIKGMNYTEDKGFGTKKVISNEMVENMVKYTENYINKTTDKILAAKFPINPKNYNGDNVSCTFCQYKDICFMQEKDIKYLSKVDDLSFLGGEE